MLLQLPHIERIQACMESLSSVVDQQQSRSSSFPTRALEWLNELESTLKDAGLPVVSEVAALRSRLLVELNGGNPIVGKGGNRRKRRDAVASEVLQDAQRAVSEALSDKQEQIREAEKVASQVVAVARVKGVIAQAQEVQPHQNAVMHVLNVMSRDSDTAAAVVALNGMLGPFDILIVLDRLIPELS